MSLVCSAVVNDSEFPRLKAYLIEATGLSYYADKNADLASRIAERWPVVQVANCLQYLKRLQDPRTGPAELDQLVEILTIGETYFFRHTELFDALRDVVLPEVIRNNSHQRRLRIWSAGCSTGAEAYSISIMLQREFASQLTDWDVEILGTDINRRFLAEAHAGRYGEWAFRSTPESIRRECFLPSDGKWSIAPAYRRGVSFRFHNLVQHPFPSLPHGLVAFDVILCRNVTIYFDQAIVMRLVKQFYETIAPTGWLLVGHSEPNVELYNVFETINTGGAVLYRKGQLEAFPQVNVEPIAWSPPEIASSIVLPAAPAFQEKPRTTIPKESPPEDSKDELSRVCEFADQGQLVQALQLCETLFPKRRLDPVTHFHHGLILEQLDRVEEAELALRRALYLDRNHLATHYHLALLLQRHGRLAEAKREFQNTLALLTDQPGHQSIPETDGLSAADLVTLVHLQLGDDATRSSQRTIN